MPPKLITNNLEQNFKAGKAYNLPNSANLLGDHFKTPNDSKLTPFEKTAAKKNVRATSEFNRSITSLKDSGFSTLASNLSRFAPEIRNPLLQSDNFYLPQQTTRTGAANVELNRWFAYYYKYHPLVGNLISLHSELPLSRFGFQGIEDPSILHFYEDMSDDMDMFYAMINFLKMWFLYGEVQPYLFWNEGINRFDDISYLDTSYIDVFTHTFFHNTEGLPTKLYSLVPDDLLIELVSTPHPKVQELVRNNLPETMIQAVQEGKPLILHNFNTDMVLRKANAWDVRGTSIVLGCLKELLYEDKLRESQYAIAEAHINPKWIWKLGQANEFMPTTDDIIAFKDTLLSANNDPIFNLVTHYAVNVQVEGSTGRILPIIPEMQFIETRIMSALFSNKSLVTGEGITYSNASVALRALMSRYIPIRSMAEIFFIKKVFLPVALANDFMKRKKADLDHKVRTSTYDVILPEFNWSHKQNLLDDSNIKNMLVQLRANSELPMKTICDTLDLDYDEIKTYLQEEQGTILDPSARKARDAAVTASTAAVDKSDEKSWWSKFLKILTQTKLPTSDEDVNKVGNVEVDIDIEVPPAQQQESVETSNAPAPPSISGGIPEESAEVPEAPGVDKPLGASKKEGLKDKELSQAIKEASRYFKKEEDGKLKLNIDLDEQFTFLKYSDYALKNFEQFKNASLKCNKCEWEQNIFLRDDAMKLIQANKWEDLKLSADKIKVLQSIYNNLRWPTIANFNEAEDKSCPGCKVGIIEEKKDE